LGGESLKDKKLFCVQCDISKYFASIDQQILLKIIQKKITDNKVLRLIEKIIKSSYDRKIYQNLFEVRYTGVPIGNLTSQLFANVYLNELDQFVKHQLRERYYLRYMDDFLILDYDKKKLHQIKEIIREFLKSRLKLDLHPKKVNVFPADSGIDFLGYLICGTHRLLRKSTVKRFIKRTKKYKKQITGGKMSQEKFNQCLQSWLAYAEFGNSRRLRRKVFEKLKLCANNKTITHL